MMEFIRRHSNSLLAKIFYFGIAVSFLIGGVSLFGGGSSSDYVAEINGERISILEVDNLYRELLNTGDFANFIDKNQDDLTDEDHQILKEQAYDIAESRLLASQLAETLQILTTNQEVAAAIQAIEYFQDSQTGEFDKSRYDNYLRQTYMTPEQFESGVREDLTRQKLLRYLALGVIDSESSLEELARVDNATGSFTILPIHFGEYSLFSQTVSEDEINSFYEVEKETLIADNRVKLSYIHFAKEDFFSRVQLDEKEVREKVAELESRTFERIEYPFSAELTEEEKKQIFDELLHFKNKFEDNNDSTNNVTLEDALKTIKSEGFEYVAEETVNQGEIGDDIFDNVLFNLTLDNPLSDPFATENGIFLLQLTAVKNILGAGVDATALVREELMETKVEDIYFEAQDQFEQLADELGDDLEAIASAMGLTLEKTDWLSLDKREGILQESSFFEAIQMLDFSADESISLPFSPNGDDGALVKIEAYEETHPMSLEEATPLIKSHLLLTQERLAIAKALDQAKDRLEKGEITLAGYANDESFNLKHFTNLSHQDLLLEVEDPFLLDILQEVFFNGALDNSYQLIEGSDGLALLYVESYQEGKTTDYTANEREQKRYFLQLEQANYEFNAIFQDFKTRSKIKRLANSFL